MPHERSHWEGCWRERTHHECALVRIAALKAELAERAASERLSHEIADRERERREDAEALLVELIAVADENDALTIERLYGKPHSDEIKTRTLDHRQRKSEAWRNARAHFANYKE